MKEFGGVIWGVKPPVSSGYGKDKHTLVAEFPPHLLMMEIQVRKTNEDASKNFGCGTLQSSYNNK